MKNPADRQMTNIMTAMAVLLDNIHGVDFIKDYFGRDLFNDPLIKFIILLKYMRIATKKTAIKPRI
jgi:hypothetical protein